MIDTVKIISMIDKNTYDKISNNSIIKTSYKKSTKEIFYEIVNDHLEGSYSSSLSVRVGKGEKYKFLNNYYIEIEGSYHKLTSGYNSHNGYYNLVSICINLIQIVNNYYDIVLPAIQHWFLQRVDIAICYDLQNNENVQKYINNLSMCQYPRRNIKTYQDESIYLTGSTTTLKIYNKLLEFKKHDLKKLKNTNFDIFTYIKQINGFIRFECEIKKKKLSNIYNTKYIRVRNVNYKELKRVWSDEFMKLLKLFDNDLNIISDKKEIEQRLYSLYKQQKASILYNFYTSIMVDGLREVKKRTKKSTYYRNIAELKKSGIDFTQTYKIDLKKEIIQFNPFEYKEVI